MSSADSIPVLEASRLSKQFGGLVALNDVSLTISRRQIFGLIGPNGAGKTTLFNCLTGLYTPTSGRVEFQNKEITGLKPSAVAASGFTRTFQNIRLFANMTALENVMVGRHVRTRANVFGAIFRTPKARSEESSIRRRAKELLDFVGLANHGGALAKHLAYGDQRRLEIARALATEPVLVALDEPAAGMNPSERTSLERLLNQLRDELGLTLLLIEHDVRLVMELCDQVAVLDYGRKIAEGSPAEVQSNPAVIAAYLGGDLA